MDPRSADRGLHTDVQCQHEDRGDLKHSLENRQRPAVGIRAGSRDQCDHAACCLDHPAVRMAVLVVGLDLRRHRPGFADHRTENHQARMISDDNHAQKPRRLPIQHIGALRELRYINTQVILLLINN